MFKGRKFKKAEKEFAKGSKTFDEFCSENVQRLNLKEKTLNATFWIRYPQLWQLRQQLCVAVFR